jgi:hypothetical protein
MARLRSARRSACARGAVCAGAGVARAAWFARGVEWRGRAGRGSRGAAARQRARAGIAWLGPRAWASRVREKQGGRREKREWGERAAAAGARRFLGAAAGWV